SRASRKSAGTASWAAEPTVVEPDRREEARMRTVRRIAALGVAAVVAGAFAAAPAGASTPEVYTGSALGQALHINALGTDLTIGESTAMADSTVTAAAESAGEPTPPVGRTAQPPKGTPQ